MIQQNVTAIGLDNKLNTVPLTKLTKGPTLKLQLLSSRGQVWSAFLLLSPPTRMNPPEALFLHIASF